MPFRECKRCLIMFKDQFRNVTGLAPITDNDVVLWKVCYNSGSQDVNSHAEIETSYYVI